MIKIVVLSVTLFECCLYIQKIFQTYVTCYHHTVHKHTAYTCPDPINPSNGQFKNSSECALLHLSEAYSFTACPTGSTGLVMSVPKWQHYTAK